MQKKDSPAWVKIVPSDNGVVTIESHMVILMNTSKVGLSCFLPGFDIYYSASDSDTAKKKAKILTRVYYNHFMNYPKQSGGTKRLVLDLHRKGFKAENDTNTITNIIRNKKVKAQFKSTSIVLPEAFKESRAESEESKFQMEET